MTDPKNTPCDLSDFRGRVRLFPLPNLVLFPHAMQPLHIFEPRYRDMLEDALAGDQLLAMALLVPGWEADYEGRPAVERVVCVGRVMSHVRLEDGTYNLLLAGMRRAEIRRELPAEKSYRIAEAALFSDEYPPAGTAARPERFKRLLASFRRLLSPTAQGRAEYERLARMDVPLGLLTDVIAHHLDLGLAQKQMLLAEPNVDARTNVLIEYLGNLPQAAPDERRPFPPEFSEN